MKHSYLERIALALIADAGLPEPVSEYRFCTERRWRFDFCYPEKMVALECEGGVWTNGRHNRGTGIQNDMEKYNEAALAGWTLIRVTKLHMINGDMIKWLKRALEIN